MRLLSPPGIGFAPLPARLGFPRHSATLIAKATLKLVPGEAARPFVPEQPFPTGDIPYSDDEAGTGGPRYESDFAPTKPAADVLVVGRFHAPGGRPVPVSEVAVSVGRRSSRLLVVGRRIWDGRRWPAPEQAAPMTELELRWENAFGGTGFEANPVGRGFVPPGQAAEKAFELPRIERPGRTMMGPDQRPEPACFAPISRRWWLRRGLAGTYDERWQKTRWPWFPEDFDFRYFNAALPELRVPDYLTGDETLAFENMHPTAAAYETRLPGQRAVAAVQRRTEAGLRMEAVPMRLDTLWVDMDAEIACLVWRGTCEARDQDLSDLVHAWVDLEPLGAATPAEEIQRRAQAAIAADEAAFEVKPKAPPPPEAPPPAPAPEAAPEPIPELAAALAKVAALQAKQPPPPAPTPEQQARLDAAAKEALARMEREEPAPEQRPAWTRQRVREVLAAGGSLAGEDLGAIDLEGEDLGGAKLAGAVLRGARLARARLAGADLTGAALRDADLGGADLAGAKLAGADLSRTTGKEVRAPGADLGGANLAGADWPAAVLDEASLEGARAKGARLPGAKLKGARLAEVDLAGAVLDGADLEGAQATGAHLARASLEAARLGGAALNEADLSHARLAGAVLTGADLTDADLEGAVAPGAQLGNARVTSLRAAGADFSGAVFDGAKGEFPIFDGARLPRASFVGAELPGADFSGAALTEAQLAGCVLRKARFARADLGGARLVGCDCFEASFEAARLDRCEGTDSSFYAAEFLDADTARFHGRNMFVAKSKLAGRS